MTRTKLSRSLILVMVTCALTLVSCGGDSGTPSQAPTPPTLRSTQHYTVVGAIDGVVANGQMTLRTEGGGVNILHFKVVSFALGNLRGEGFAQADTIDNSLTILLTLDTPDLGYVQVSGRKRFSMLGYGIKVIDDFTLSGGYSDIVFTATSD